MIIEPTIDQLSKGKYNRFTLVIATAKGARMVTDDYVSQRERAENLISGKETDKPLFALIDQDCRDEKAVKVAIDRLMKDEYKIVNAPELDGTVSDRKQQ